MQVWRWFTFLWSLVIFSEDEKMRLQMSTRICKLCFLITLPLTLSFTNHNITIIMTNCLWVQYAALIIWTQSRYCDRRHTYSNYQHQYEYITRQSTKFIYLFYILNFTLYSWRFLKIMTYKIVSSRSQQCSCCPQCQWFGK